MERTIRCVDVDYVQPRLESSAGVDLSQLPTRASWKPALLVIALIFTAAAGAQTGKPDSKPDSDAVSRLRIEVTGGDQNKPVADASVYVKFSEDRKIRRDKKYELSLKTNQQGVTRSPEIPQGRILIQIVAPGWKTYGEWHDVSQNEQTIAIHLVRPVRPY